MSKIMTESFDLLLNRDNNINKLSEKAADLRDGAKSFKGRSEKLKMSLYFKQYMAPILICVVIFLFIILKWWLF